MKTEIRAIGIGLVLGVFLGIAGLMLVQNFEKPQLVFEEGITARGSWCAFLTEKRSRDVAITCDFSQTNRTVQQPGAQQ